MNLLTRSFLAVLAVSALTLAQTTYPEIEPNETKLLATPANPMIAGDAVTGTTTGGVVTAGAANSLDQYLLTNTPLPLGIYRHRMTITTAGTAGHVGSIRGLNQSLGVAGVTDTTIQSSSTVTVPPRYNQWYGFGKGESLYYRVTGATTTTLPYVSTLSTSTVTPTVIAPVFAAGPITITTKGQGHSTDTDLWVYDSALNAIAACGNDDEPAPGTTLQSLLTRTYAPGTYYLALTNFQMASNQTAPIDDRYKSGTLMDFADSVANSSTAINVNVAFSISDGVCTVPTAAVKTSQYDVLWYQFTVAAVTNVAPWDSNSAACDLNLNGATGTTNGPINVNACVGATVNLNFNSTLANGYEVAIGLAPGVAAASCLGPGAGGINTLNGQAINVDFSDPTLLFLNLLAFPAFPTPGYTLSFAVPAPIANISAQMLIFDGGHPDGFQMSAFNQLHILANSPIIPGPAGDDIGLILVAGTPISPVGCYLPLTPPTVDFYGTTYTTYAVQTNGRITYGGTNTSFTPVNPGVAGNLPYCGYWTDLNTTVGGNITIELVAGGIRVNYNAVSYFAGTAAVNSTFKVSAMTNGDVLIDNAGPAIALAAGTGNAAFGTNPGGAVGFAAGVPVAPWANGTTYAPVTPLDAIGVFGLRGSALNAAVVSVAFTWSALGYTLNVL